MSERQLTLDGREVERVTRARPLTDRQCAVLRVMRAHDDVRPLLVGMLMHEGRERLCACFEGVPCRYASSDGADALKRLARRGLVARASRGHWRAVVGVEDWTSA